LPQWTESGARELAKEVEDALTSPHWREFLANMWGSKPVAWDGRLKGWDRLRTIVNAMTRMRFCTPDGEMELLTKGGVLQTPEGYLPWFDVPTRQSANSVLISGHWSALGLKLTHNLLALDTGCVWGGMLTAVRLEDRAIFQVKCSEDEIQACIDG
jgi:bis(5'-nucleosyl)-tetraphosphatase (symmetrical)